MPYANSASVLVIGGLSQQPVVTARLKDVYTTVGGPSGPEQHEDEFDSTTFQSSTGQVAFSMVRGPGGLLPSRDVTLTMDIATGPQDGPIFRSGVFTTLPPTPPADPNGFIDIVLDDMRTVTQATIDAGLPATPFTATGTGGESVTITSLTATVGSGSIDVSTSGTAVHPSAPAPQPFSYMVALSMVPETSARDLSSTLVVWAPAAGTLTFTSGGGVAGAMQAAVLSLLAGFIERDLRSAVVTAVNTAVNAAAIAATATALGVATPAGSPPALPAGVILSFRRVVVGTIGGVTGIHVWAALGSFGSLRAKFPPAPSGGGRTCALALVALSVPSVDLMVFRDLRDQVLIRTSAGRLAVHVYYRASPRLAGVLAGRPGVARAAGRAAAIAQRPITRHLRRT
jgi:hypothetical protein